ncbi:MAG TPA: hypothetical protein VME18_00245 [Acidobacteriaceae bacterium]|nr:hypothetical protein [Acidobacteriaceae bacterium]
MKEAASSLRVTGAAQDRSEAALRINFTRVDNANPGLRLPFSAEGGFMVATPNTWGVMLLFLGIFLTCIVWATHGSPGMHDSEEEDLQATGKSS